MKKQIKITIPLAFILSFSLFIGSCERDFVLENQAEQQLVLLSNFTPDSVVQVIVTTSTAIGDTSNINSSYPPDVELQLMENGNPVGGFDFFDNSPFYVPTYISDYHPKQNAVYSIEANLDDFPTAMASNAIPEPVAIESTNLVSLDSFYIEDEYFRDVLFYQMRVKINIPDNARSAKYFHLKVWRYIMDDTGYTLLKEESLGTLINVSQEISILHESGSMFEGQAFTDHPDGIEVDLTFFHYDYFEMRTPVYFELRHVSADYFLFHKSIGQQEGTSVREGLLADQAISIHNNIIDGIGNFGGYSVALDSIVW